MNTETNEYKHMGPSSLTHLFVPEKTHPKTYWIDAYKAEFSTLILEYKAAFLKLQLTLLEEELDNGREIGRYFQKLEDRFDKIISTFRKN